MAAPIHHHISWVHRLHAQVGAGGATIVQACNALSPGWACAEAVVNLLQHQTPEARRQSTSERDPSAGTPHHPPMLQSCPLDWSTQDRLRQLQKQRLAHAPQRWCTAVCLLLMTASVGCPTDAAHNRRRMGVLHDYLHSPTSHHTPTAPTPTTTTTLIAPAELTAMLTIPHLLQGTACQIQHQASAAAASPCSICRAAQGAKLLQTHI